MPTRGQRPELLIDRSLGRHAVAAAFRDAGYTAVTTDEAYGTDESISDHVWIEDANEHGLAVVCKDKRLRKSGTLERAALAQASDIRVLVLTSGGLTRQQMSELFTQAMGSIDALWRREGPWLQSISRSGRIETLAIDTAEAL